ncbi:MAG: hypothetical protein KME59_09485 [Trichormus sp. ATA11-4-KO1]|nr:hypothetical protein [Trichormus sp. ATA11-4-KO1]
MLVPQSLQILANRRVRSQLFGNEKIKLRSPMAGNRMALSFLWSQLVRRASLAPRTSDF